MSPSLLRLILITGLMFVVITLASVPLASQSPASANSQPVGQSLQDGSQVLLPLAGLVPSITSLISTLGGLLIIGLWTRPVAFVLSGLMAFAYFIGHFPKGFHPLINGGTTADGTRILKAETIEWATKVRTKDFHRDLIFNQPVNRALTVVVAGDDGLAFQRGFGRNSSPRAFGHGGAGGQIGWGDPETGVSVGYCTDGFVDDLTMGRRGLAISSLAGQVLA